MSSTVPAVTVLFKDKKPEIGQQPLFVCPAQFPYFFKKPPIVDGSDLVYHDVRRLYHPRFTSRKMYAQDFRFRFHLRRDRADDRTRMNGVQKVGLDNHNRTDLAGFRP